MKYFATVRQILAAIAAGPFPELDEQFHNVTAKHTVLMDMYGETYKVVITRHVGPKPEATVPEEEVQDADRGKDSSTEAPSEQVGS